VSDYVHYCTELVYTLQCFSAISSRWLLGSPWSCVKQPVNFVTD